MLHEPALAWIPDSVQVAGRLIASFIAAGVTAAPLAPALAAAHPATGHCIAALERTRVQAPVTLPVRGFEPVEYSLDVPSGRALLLEARESGIDVLVSTSGVQPSAAADHPVRRSGARHMLLEPQASALTVRVRSKEHAGLAGRVTLQVYDLAGLDSLPDCERGLRLLAQGDREYASGQDTSLGRATHADSARHSYLSAAESYLAAVDAFAAAGDADLEAETALAVASLYYQDLKDWARSADWAARTHRVAERENDAYVGARADAILGADWIESPRLIVGHMDERNSAHAWDIARTLLRRVARFHDHRAQPYDAALQINNLGATYFREDRFEEAATAYKDARLRFESLGEWPRMAVAMHNVALCEWGLGDLRGAEKSLDAALARQDPSPFPNMYLFTLNNHAVVSYELGHYDRALSLASQALDLATTVQLRLPEAHALQALGLIYYGLGDRTQSQYYLERARDLESPDEHVRIEVHRALATIYRDAGDPERAEREGRAALELAAVPTARSRIRTGLARDAAALGREAQGLATLDAILSGDARRDPVGTVQALIARAGVERARPAEARRDFEAALMLLRRLDDPWDLFDAKLGLARAMHDQGNDAEALSAADAALALAPALRQQTANPELRAQHLEPLRGAYDLKIALLTSHRTKGPAAVAGIRRGENAALASADGSRAQALESFAQVGPAKLTRDGKAPRPQYRRALYEDLAARRYELEVRLDRTGEIDARVRELRASIARLRREADYLDAALGHSGASRLVSADPHTWVGWLKARAPRSAIIEFWLAGTQAYAWTATTEGVEMHSLGDSAVVTAAARRTHDAFRDYARVPRSERDAAAGELYDLILRPLEGAVGAREHWIIVPDGALSYVPFAALMNRADGNRYVAESHDVATAPAIWWLLQHSARNVRAPRELLLIADPVYETGDPRLAGLDPRGRVDDGPSLHRLPWTAREGDGIARLFPPGTALVLQGLSATRNEFLKQPLADFRYIHIAAHAQVDGDMPQLSSLLLGAYDGTGARVPQALRVADLEELRLRADVVTLSACDTALGREVAGEGAIGLSYVALARGAGVVISSLWQVPDEMSAEVMTEFYRELRVGGVNAPSALAGAMRHTLRQRGVQDPALWSAFQLMIGTPPG
jgi:CHAT domain-containing protein